MTKNSRAWWLLAMGFVFVMALLLLWMDAGEWNDPALAPEGACSGSDDGSGADSADRESVRGPEEDEEGPRPGTESPEVGPRTAAGLARASSSGDRIEGAVQGTPTAGRSAQDMRGDLGRYSTVLEVKLTVRSSVRRDTACCLSSDGEILVTCSDLKRDTALRRIRTSGDTDELKTRLPIGVGLVRQLLFSRDEKSLLVVHTHGVRRISASDLSDMGTVKIPKPRSEVFVGWQVFAAGLGSQCLLLAESLQLQPHAEHTGVLVERREGKLFLGVLRRNLRQFVFASSRQGQLAVILSTEDRRGGGTENMSIPRDSLFLLDLSGQDVGSGSVVELQHGNRENRRHEVGSLVAVGPSGRLVAVGRDDGSILLFDRAGHPLGKGLQAGSEITLGATDVVCFSADGAKLLSGHRGGCIALWDVEKGRLCGLLERFAAKSDTPGTVSRRGHVLREIHCSDDLDVIVVVSESGIMRILKLDDPSAATAEER